MRETSIMNNLNCKTQAHARMCEENKLELELEEIMIPIETILWLLNFKGPLAYKYVY